MKSKLLAILDSFLISNLWFVYIFLDHRFGRRLFLNKYAVNRPDFFQRYYRWKPVLSNPRRIVVVKTDAIGDYLLFRNFLEETANEFRPLGYRIHLIGNQMYKDLAQHLDAGFVDQFHWLNRGGLNTRPSLEARIHLLSEVNQFTYSTVLYPNLSRETAGGDWLVEHIPGRHKIGFKGDLQNQTREEHLEGNRIYTKLIEPEEGVKFEFYRNQEIAEALLKRKSNLLYPRIEINHEKKPLEKYAVLFPGASAASKQWPADGFAEAGKWLIDSYGLKILLAGGPGDLALCQQVQDKLPTGSENLAGKTSLVELMFIIKGASILISNDTVAIHLGIQLGVPSVCPFKCNHYGRFLPYPEQAFPKVRICIPDKLHSLSRKQLEDAFSQNYGDEISGISVGLVKDSVKELLKS